MTIPKAIYTVMEKKAIFQTLSRFEGRTKTILFKFFYDGLSQRELAKEMKLSRSTVQKILHKAFTSAVQNLPK